MTILDVVTVPKLCCLICLNPSISVILFSGFLFVLIAAESPQRCPLFPARSVFRRHCSWTVARAERRRVSLFRYYVTSGLPRKRPVHTQRRLNGIRWRDLTRFWPRCPSVCLGRGEITARPDSRVSGGKSLRARHAKVTRPRRDGLFISGWK